jgi:carboxylesterase type B
MRVLGTNFHEARFAASPKYGVKWPLVADALSYTVAVTAMYPDAFLKIFNHYGLPSDADANDRLTRVMDDSWFHCAARALARGLSEQGVDAYLYSFELSPAVHTQEIDYVFGFPDGLKFSSSAT